LRGSQLAGGGLEIRFSGGGPSSTEPDNNATHHGWKRFLQDGRILQKLGLRCLMVCARKKKGVAGSTKKARRCGARPWPRRKHKGSALKRPELVRYRDRCGRGGEERLKRASWSRKNREFRDRQQPGGLLGSRHQKKNQKWFYNLPRGSGLGRRGDGTGQDEHPQKSSISSGSVKSKSPRNEGRRGGSRAMPLRIGGQRAAGTCLRRGIGKSYRMPASDTPLTLGAKKVASSLNRSRTAERVEGKWGDKPRGS